MKRISIGSLVLALALPAPAALAGVMATPVTPVANNVGGYAMTGFQPATPFPGTATSATSLNGDQVFFTGKNGSPAAQPMTVGDRTQDGSSWWSGATDTYYKAAVSGQNAVNWLELVLPANTFAFSLTLDASAAVNAWVLGVDSAGNAVDTQGSAYTLLADGNYAPSNPPFAIQLRNGQAQSFGFYMDNAPGSCATLAKVVVDPTYWGMGDFSINVGSAGCGTDTRVPEPTPVVLLVGGLALLTLRGRLRRS